MRVRLDIKRQRDAQSAPYLQSILYESGDENVTLASALGDIDAGGFKDTDGREVEPIIREQSCLQKKCGACAVVVDGRPALACGTRLRDFERKGYVSVGPLRKFPVIADLLVDRSVIFSQLTQLGIWAENALPCPENTDDIAYEASRCLQCGCCLEVCPNFCPGEKFFGMSAAAAASRLLEQLPPSERRELEKTYSRHFYSGCGKSLACRDICPAGIDTESLMVNSNAAAVWKFLGRRKHG